MSQSKKIQMVRKKDGPSSAADKAPLDQAVANEIHRGMEGVDGHADPVGAPGDPGEPGIPGIPVEKFGNENHPLQEAVKQSSHASDYWLHEPRVLSQVPKENQPLHYEGAQMSRRVAIARGIVAVEIHGVGVIVDGCLLAGYKLVDVNDVNDRSVVVERMVRK